MELKTISEIRTLSPNELTSYRRGVMRAITDETEYTPSDISRILDFITCPDFEVVISDYVFSYLLAFFKEAFEDATWRIRTVEAANMCTDTNLWVFSWVLSGNTRCVFLNETQKTIMQNALTALDAGVELDIIRDQNIAALEADTENRSAHHAFLRLLGVLPNSESTVIPILSESLEVDESTARFSSAIWFEEIQKKTIIIAGLGGIGSYVAFLLARMHPLQLWLYDDDKVEMVNMAGQLYKVQNVGQYKVDAMADMMRDYASYSNVVAIRERYTNETEAADIMICGFDNMEARRTFFTRWTAHVITKSAEERKHCLFLDGRLSAEELQVLCIRGDDDFNIDRYREHFLFSDDEADETLCSYKQTTYMANMIGSLIVNLFTNFVANELVENLRDLPFFTSYAADSMMFKTEQ